MILRTSCLTLIIVSACELVRGDPLYSVTPVPNPTSGESSSAVGINDAGQIIGASYGPVHAFETFVYDHGSVAYFGGGGSQAVAINNSGQVIFKMTADTRTGSVTLGYVYQSGSVIPISASTETENIIPTSIDNLGDVVGILNLPRTGSQPFLYNSGALTFLTRLEKRRQPWGGPRGHQR